MTGYRRIEPAFCRGCGTPWTPGADACPSCGEVIVRDAVAGGDPYGPRKLRVGLLSAVAAMGLAWAIPLFGYDNVTANFVEWTAGLAGIVGLVLIVAQFMFPGGLGPILAAPRRGSSWLEAAGAGLVLGGAFVFVLEVDTVPFLAPSAGATALVAFAALVVFEELLFRGVLFEGVEAFAGKWNAVIASTLLFGLMRLSPPVAALGLVAALLRLRTGSAWSAIAFRLVAAAIAFAFGSEISAY